MRTPRRTRRSGLSRYLSQDSGQSWPARATGARSRGSGGCGQITKNAGRLAGSQQRERTGRPTSPGSYRSNGGFLLSPERHTETIDAISRARKAEPAISADMQTAERENTSGGWLEGFDHRLKGDDRLKEKVAEKLRDRTG